MCDVQSENMSFRIILNRLCDVSCYVKTNCCLFLFFAVALNMNVLKCGAAWRCRSRRLVKSSEMRRAHADTAARMPCSNTVRVYFICTAATHETH